MKTSTLELLKKQLSLFGLNPMDWRIFRIRADHFEIRHRQEKELVLNGHLEFNDQRPRWRSLELVSF